MRPPPEHAFCPLTQPIGKALYLAVSMNMADRLLMVYRFDDFLLDPVRSGLSLNGKEVPLEPQVLRLLLYLLEARDQIVSKDELIEGVWDGRIVSDATINTCIRSVRRALGDDRGQQRYIRTFPKRGFQFVGALRDGEENRDDTTERRPSISQRLSKPRLLVAAAFVSVLAIAIGAWWWIEIDGSSKPGLPLPDKPSIAVLKFDNLSNDPDQAYFVDGLIEDLITDLSLNRELFVISSNSTFAYADHSVGAVQIGRELGVAYIVRGSIRRAENRVRINAELVDARTGSTVWSERFDRELTDIFALQDEISRTIAGRLAPEVIKDRVDKIRNIPTTSLDAWDLYLQAKATQTEFTSARQAEAIRLADLAIQRDPSFAAPYALIAKAKGVQFFHQWADNPEQTLAEAIDSARAAIRLDGNDPAAFAALGYVYRLTGDETRAIGHLERARHLNPNDANIRLELAHTLDWFRKQDRALPEILEAIRLSPRDPRLELMYFYKAHILFHLRNFEASLAAAREMGGVLTNDTWRTFYHLIRAANFAYLGREDEALLEVKNARGLSPGLSLTSIRRRFEESNNHPENRRIWLDALRKAGMPEE